MTILIILIFLFIALLILVAGIMAVTAKNIVHAALWLIASFFGVGALYMLLEAEFAAVIQVLVYVGAIAILVLFAIMLTRHIDEADDQQVAPIRFWGALVICAAIFGLLIVPSVLATPWQPKAQNVGIASAVQLGQAFMREYLLPFEVASVLLLVALVGAIVIVFEERSRRRRVLTLAEEVALRRSQNATASANESPVLRADEHVLAGERPLEARNSEQ